MNVALVHRPGDSVGVATTDLKAGDTVVGRYRDLDDQIELEMRGDVPLGHKIAIIDLAAGDEVVEYGEVIGLATEGVRAGAHVHVHNLKGQRWV